MGEFPVWMKIRLWFGSVGWRLFLWGNMMTEEQYFAQIDLEHCVTELQNLVIHLKAEIKALCGEFCELYDGDFDDEAVSLLLTKMHELSNMDTFHLIRLTNSEDLDLEKEIAL